MRRMGSAGVIELSREMGDAIRRIHGESGGAWVADLPRRISSCVDAWSLHLDVAVPSSSACVIHGRDATGGPVTLKLVASAPGFESERAALVAFAGRVSVRLIANEPAMSALLLERAVPGDRLSTLVRDGEDESANRAAASVLQGIGTQPGRLRLEHLTHVGVEAAATLERYLHAFGGGVSGPISGRQIARAASMIEEMQQSVVDVVVLHADLHHDNLLRAEREPWLAIDPKGRLGEPAAELAAFIRNPIDHLANVPDLRAFLRRRIDQLIELLGYDRNRVLAWAVGLATVAACWQLEDRESGWERWLLVADALA